MIIYFWVRFWQKDNICYKSWDLKRLNKQQKYTVELFISIPLVMNHPTFLFFSEVLLIIHSITNLILISSSYKLERGATKSKLEKLRRHDLVLFFYKIPFFRRSSLYKTKSSMLDNVESQNIKYLSWNLSKYFKWI